MDFWTSNCITYIIACFSMKKRLERGAGCRELCGRAGGVAVGEFEALLEGFGEAAGEGEE